MPKPGPFIDIRRQTIGDMTDALVSMRRIERTITTRPRFKASDEQGHAVEQEARTTVSEAIAAVESARNALEILDTL